LQVEGVLKTVGAPLDAVVATYRAVLVAGSAADLSRILDLKGTLLRVVVFL
jgi:hypothetical protein